MPVTFMLSDNAHIAIAGGGLLGRLLAWQLLEAGHQVTLFDAGSFEHSPSAANTAAGMISPVSEAIDTEPLMYDLGLVALKQWPLWLNELASSMPNTPSIHYGAEGSLILAHHRDHSLLEQYRLDLQRQLPADAQSQWLNQSDILQLESDVSEQFQQGLFLPQEAHIDNRQLLDVLLERIQQLGGHCVANTSVDVSPYTVHVDSDDPASDQKFDQVLDCRGVGAKPQWRDVRGVRGEVLRVQTDEIKLSRPVRLLHPRYQLYVVPKLNNEFVIGATQIESEDRSPVSVQSALELTSALYTINSAFAEARIIEMESNLRPSLNDNRPQIQHEEGLVRVNGLYRHGYLLAPVVVQYTMALLTDNTANKKSLVNDEFASILYKNMAHNKQIENIKSIKGAANANAIA